MTKKILGLILVLSLVFAAGAMAAPSMKLLLEGKSVKGEVKDIGGKYYISVDTVASIFKKEASVNKSKGTINFVTPKAKSTSKPPAKESGTTYLGKLKLYDVQVDDNFGIGYIVSVEVYNGESKSYAGLLIKATFYDANGKRVGTADGAINDLAKGDTKTMEMISMDDLGKAKSYKFQLDGSY